MSHGDLNAVDLCDQALGLVAIDLAAEITGEAFLQCLGLAHV